MSGIKTCPAHFAANCVEGNEVNMLTGDLEVNARSTELSTLSFSVPSSN